MFSRKKNILLFIISLIIISSFLRFYNLNWGAPFYFHPDERNIASSVSQLEFPAQMNPRFFAYGSLPIYAIYSTGVLINLLSRLLTFNLQVSATTVSFDQAIQISRFFSAVFSLALIPLLFLIGKKIKNEKAGLIAASLAAFSTGLIQFAHFGTFEMWLTFFSLLLFLLCLKALERKGVFLIILLGIVFGILASTKVSHLILLPIPLLVTIIKQIRKKRAEINTQKVLNFENLKFDIVSNFEFRISNLIKDILLFLLITILIFFITNPFVILDYSSFIDSMKYESGVALGTTAVFYTNEFISSIPVVFQFLHVYPFLINPALTILFIPSFFYVLFITIKHKHIPFLLLTSYFLLLFLPQVFLYAKWTRYMVPTLPFIYLIYSIAFADLWKFISKKHQLFAIRYSPFAILISINLLFGISYFITAFVQKDTRVASKDFAKQYVPSNAPILSEVYDLGITPFNDLFHNITLYNFYDLDNNSPQYTPATLAEHLAISDYIILPSQRILKVRLLNAKTYPNGTAFYQTLFEREKGFQKIYETPCDFFCAVTYLNNPVFSFEETASVFDRPTVFIFKKIDNL